MKLAFAWERVSDAPKDIATRLNAKMPLLVQALREIARGAAGVAVLAGGSATPSVAGHRVWRVRNTSAQTVTMLREGDAGQQVLLVFEDGNTTLQHGPDLVLVGAVNYTGAAGRVLALVTVDGTTWREYPNR